MVLIHNIINFNRNQKQIMLGLNFESTLTYPITIDIDLMK